MKIAVLLRKTENNSLFRKALLKISAIQGEELYLCSGTLTQITKDPMLLKYIGHGFQGTTNPKLITLGQRASSDCKNSDPIGHCQTVPTSRRTSKCNACKYKEFVIDFINRGNIDNYSVNAYREKQDKWHSKIAIKVRDGQPIAAIIGSSNLSIPAYGEKCTCKSGTGSCTIHSWISYRGPFPFECDVLFWDDVKIKNLCSSSTDIDGDSVSFNNDNIIVANPDRDVKKDLVEELNTIKDLIADPNMVDSYSKI